MIDRINQLETSRAEHRELLQLTFANHEKQIALQLAEFRQEMRDMMARLDVKIESRYADLMRWSLVYWLGAVGSIAALAKILP